VKAEAVQASLKRAFERWGRPQHMRFDNGKPWGNPQIRVPTALALWLVGLDIEPLFGRPRQSTDNAVVERGHGVLDAWVEPAQCADTKELSAHLDKFTHIQRETYPVKEGKSRMELYPQLGRVVRQYDPEQEAQRWTLEAVFQYMARYIFTRTVEKNGRITIMTGEYYLGRQYRAQKVTVQLDVQWQQWVVKDRLGEIIAHFEPQQLNYTTLAGLTLSSRNRKGAKPHVVSDGVHPYSV
jgi:hypothetical protein